MDRHIQSPLVWLESKFNWPFTEPLWLPPTCPHTWLKSQTITHLSFWKWNSPIDSFLKPEPGKMDYTGAKAISPRHTVSMHVWRRHVVAGGHWGPDVRVQYNKEIGGYFVLRALIIVLHHVTLVALCPHKVCTSVLSVCSTSDRRLE